MITKHCNMCFKPADWPSEKEMDSGDEKEHMRRKLDHGFFFHLLG